MIWPFRARGAAPTPPAEPVKLRSMTASEAAKIGNVNHVTPPIRLQGPYAWDLETIRSTRDQQLRGDFENPVRLAEAFRTDDALFFAYQSRVATASAVALDWKSAASTLGPLVRERMKCAIHAPAHVRQSLLGTMVNHGIAVGYVERTACDDPTYGPTVHFTLNEWPLEHVKFYPADNRLKTRTREVATYVDITHGDGFWVVFRKFGIAPWTQDACVLPGALLWAAHASGISDWAGASSSHGSPKVVGELPPGVRLGNEDGTGLSPEAGSFLEMIRQLVEGDSAAGIRPAGAQTQMLYNGSNAWQVFSELITNRDRAAARIYCGTDAILGAMGGAPGVDTEGLFKVAETRVAGDFEALERGLWEGIAAPWCLLHGVALDDAARQAFELPDADADRRGEQEASAVDRLSKSVVALKQSNVEVTQATIDQLTKTLGVSVVCKLAAATAAPTTSIQLASTDVVKVITVAEARGSQGLAPFGDERDDQLVSALPTGGSGGAGDGSTDDPAADDSDNSEVNDSGDSVQAFADREIQTGPKGGRYYVGASGKKVYVRGAPNPKAKGGSGAGSSRRAKKAAPAEKPAKPKRATKPKTAPTEKPAKPKRATKPKTAPTEKPAKPKAAPAEKPDKPKRATKPKAAPAEKPDKPKRATKPKAAPAEKPAKPKRAAKPKAAPAHDVSFTADVAPARRAELSAHIDSLQTPGIRPAKFAISGGSNVVYDAASGETSAGYYNRSSHSIVAAAKFPADMSRIDAAEAAKPKDTPRSVLGTSGETTLTHEYAHHIHLSLGDSDPALSVKVDATIRDAYKKACPKAVQANRADAHALAVNLSKVDQEGAASKYGTVNHKEFWAEAYTAHRHLPESTKKHRPEIYALVENVLSMIKAKA